MIGDITNKPMSVYQPSKEVCALTTYVKKDYSQGEDILSRSWVELNNRSIIDDENRGQRMFNAFVDENVEDPAQAWKWRGTRSKARNKAIAMHASLTAAYIIPMFSAQNEDDEMDRDFSDFMRDIVEWMTISSDYRPAFLQVVFGMLTNPVTYLGAEYTEVYQKVKIKQEDGSLTTKEIIDEVLSGFHAPIYSSNQVLITNAYERNIQKQRSITKREWIEHSEAEAQYSEHEHWDFVQPGMTSVIDDNGRFYDIKDDDHPSLVEKVTYLNRREDTEVCFLGGIYMGDTDVDANPIRHRDNFDAPRYNVVPFGYSRIGEHFFYYKSMMNALGWDNMLYDAMAEIGMNRAILETEMPLAISGSGKIDTEVIFPNSVVAFENKDTKVQPLLPASNLNALFAAMKETDDSISEGSVSDTEQGKLPDASQKAYSVAQAQANARKMISGVGKSVGESVSQVGLLMSDIALNHLSVPQVADITSDSGKLKYRKFLLENKNVGGRVVSKELRFDENLLGSDMTNDQRDEKNLKLLEEVGYPDHSKHIYVANPELFARMKYLTRVDPSEMFPKNEEYMQALLMGLYAQLNADPMIERESLLRKLLYSYFHGEADELIAKRPMSGMQGLPAQAPTSKTSAAGNSAQQKAVSTGAPNAPAMAGV